ncbi:ROK family protein [Pseudactinotalea sp. HY160]|uniref:ROK family transcriptional regulator n=1 Tax=Pseudactinotalea sp. HY160 TaxID=2654490 RepID=UPI00128E41EF|nr:ROK family transcriptional regulator [Pseudactinotalea sp. HY160]MPV49706.1 ROK family protein [Pseudactinotalea sp. HY160]
MDNGRIAGTPSLLRSLNDRTTAGLLFDHGTLSKAELGAASGLSKPTAAQSLQRLTDLGLVTTGGSRTGGPGPAAQLFELDPTTGYAIAVDVANEIVRASIHGRDGSVLGNLTSIPGGRMAGEVLVEIFTTLTAEVPISPQTTYSMAVGVSGAYDEVADLVRHGDHLSELVGGLEQPGLRERISAAVPARVTIENDVKLVALAESSTGAAAEAATSVLFWAEAGVGAAAVLGGHIHRGATGSAGELAYLPVAGGPHTSPREPRGGFQVVAGGAALTELGRACGLAGDPAGMIAAAAAAPGTHGEEFLTELARRYATGISALIAVLDPEVVVLSGSYAAAGGQVLADRVAGAVADQAMRPVPVVLGALTDRPVLTGAAHLARSKLRQEVLERIGPVA